MHSSSKKRLHTVLHEHFTMSISSEAQLKGSQAERIDDGPALSPWGICSLTDPDQTQAMAKKLLMTGWGWGYILKLIMLIAWML